MRSAPRCPAASQAIQVIAGRNSSEEVRRDVPRKRQDRCRMNYVVSLVGSLRIDPPLQPFAVAMLNDDFHDIFLQVMSPDVWTRVRLRVSSDGMRLVLDEEPDAPQIEGWGEYFWISEQLAYVVAAIGGFESVVSGALHRRGDHRDDIFVVRVKGVEVYEHHIAYATAGKLIPVPQDRVLIDHDPTIVDGDE